MPRVVQNNMTGGVISPELITAKTLARYQVSVAEASNWFFYAQGGAKTRPGFEFVSRVRATGEKDVRMIPFNFNTEDTYALIFAGGYMQVIRNGAMVVEANKTIVSISQANPCSVQVTAHGFATGERIYITNAGQMTELNGRYCTVTVTGANTFTLDGVDSTGYTAYSSGGYVNRIYSLAIPYSNADLQTLNFTQSADTMTITHENYAPRNLTRTGHAAWTLTTINFSSLITAPTGVAVTELGSGTSGTPKDYRYRVTSVDTDGNESAASAIVVLTTTTYSLSTTRYADITWTQVAGADYYNVYKENSTSSGIFGFIGESDQSVSPRFKDFNFGPDMSKTPPILDNPFASANNYPIATTYHQGRQLYGGTANNPNNFWASQPDNYYNLNYSRPTKDDDRIFKQITAREVNGVRHILSMRDLIIMTSGGIWKLAADEDGVLTPANSYFVKQSNTGAAYVRPIQIEDLALYVQEGGTRIRAVGYTFDKDQYSGSDLTNFARHLFENYEITDWAYCEEPYGLLWARRDDGQLLTLTYLPEQQVMAWSEHETQGEVLSLCSVRENNENALYIAVRRNINGSDTLFVERLHDFVVEDTTINAFCVDSGLSYASTGYAISAATQTDPVNIEVVGHPYSDGDTVRVYDVEGMTELNQRTFTVDNVSGDTFDLVEADGSGFAEYTGGGMVYLAVSELSNLWHLEGMDVCGLADGNVIGMDNDSNLDGLTVTNGALTLPYAAAVVHIGLPYTCDIRDLEPRFSDIILEGRKKRISRAWLRVQGSRGLRVGADENSLYEFPERTPAMGYGNIEGVTGVEDLKLSKGWTDYGQMLIRQAYPLPAKIIAITKELSVDA